MVTPVTKGQACTQSLTGLMTQAIQEWKVKLIRAVKFLFKKLIHTDCVGEKSSTADIHSEFRSTCEI